MNMARLLTILLIGLVFEAIGVVLLSRGLKEISGWLFSAKQVKDVSGLAHQLSRHADPVSQFVWDQLASDQQQTLAAPDASTGKREALTEALNRSMAAPNLYAPDRFAAVQLPEQTRALLAQGPEGDDQIRLNRRLLESAFPGELEKVEARPVLSEWLHLVGRGITNPHIVMGVFFEALFFVALLLLMAKSEVSFIWPLTSLGFVVTTIAAKLYLHEYVSPLRWCGVCLIMMGAALISWTEKNPSPPSPAPRASASPARPAQ
jgi:multidrug transporter EmrE-like cation transporter